MTLHMLKTVNPYFDHLWDRTKQFEVRKNDRDFECHDSLILRRWHPTDCAWSPAYIQANISYILTDDFEGVSPGYVVLGLKDMCNCISPITSKDLSDVGGKRALDNWCERDAVENLDTLYRRKIQRFINHNRNLMAQQPNTSDLDEHIKRFRDLIDSKGSILRDDGG